MLASGLGGYIGWLLWGTGLETAKAQDRLRATVERDWQRTTPPPQGDERYLPGEAYAALAIPSIGLDVIVVEAPVGPYSSYGWTSALKEGPAHYPDSADPWDGTGRVGIAGHRTTYLHPFLDLDRVQVGDRIRLFTKHGTFLYEVDRVFEVPESGSGVVLDQTPEPTLVLTTCHPKYSSRERLIVTATQTEAPSTI